MKTPRGSSNPPPSDSLGAPHEGSPRDAVDTLDARYSPSRTSLPSKAERFVDLGERARGGMGSIHEIFDEVLRRRLALKVLRLDEGAEPDTLPRFLEEARITAQLDHPNIVPVYDMEPEGPAPSFAMKLIEGRTLVEVVADAHTRELTREVLDDLLTIFMKLCEAVAFAHSRGVLHRDLKPENVMVGEFGQVYLMDWGVARVLPAETGRARSPRVDLGPGYSSGSVENDGVLVGTPAYMAPEQAWGRSSETDERTDVYGLGGVLYYILTGEPPHGARKASVARASSAVAGQRRPPPTSSGWREVPPSLYEIALRALSPKPADRHASATELQRDVQEFIRGGGWFWTQTFESGEAIVTEGDPGDTAYVIVEGRCDVFRDIAGERTFLRRLERGDVFGELAIFASGKRTATVVANGPVRVKVVTRAALERELDRNRWLRTFVIALAERFVATEADLDEARQRLNRP